ncbi:MAG: DUF1175 domain-containing protein [Pyrinomonadaceae bacterium MAG19_C2-C3]|nr:DUF1175 domain-containing protein [Pyrinomonadaceae bacterium MAG19_C2-C3]
MRAFASLIPIVSLAVCLIVVSACRRVNPTSVQAEAPPASNINRALDSDADGFPDAIELRTESDRENFRRWFTSIASAQYDEVSSEWQAAQRDCAGLVRFALRESLRHHDRQWQRRVSGVGEVAADVSSATLENYPSGAPLFRVADGAYREDDYAANRFDSFADARTLKNHNATFIGRDVRDALPGDLMFFHQPFAGRFPYHVMIYLGADERDNDRSALVVYHTGASPDVVGSVRRVAFETLARHPDARWRSVKANPHFLGFYRLKILN